MRLSFFAHFSKLLQPSDAVRATMIMWLQYCHKKDGKYQEKWQM